MAVPSLSSFMASMLAATTVRHPDGEARESGPPAPRFQPSSPLTPSGVAFIYPDQPPLPESGLVQANSLGNGMWQITYRFGGLVVDGAREMFQITTLAQQNPNETMTLLWALPVRQGAAIAYSEAVLAVEEGAHEDFVPASVIGTNVIRFNNGRAVAIEVLMVDGLPYARAVEVQAPPADATGRLLRVTVNNFETDIRDGEEYRALVGETVVRYPELLRGYRVSSSTPAGREGVLRAHLLLLGVPQAQAGAMVMAMTLDANNYEVWLTFVAAYAGTPFLTLDAVQKFAQFFLNPLSSDSMAARLVLQSVDPGLYARRGQGVDQLSEGWERAYSLSRFWTTPRYLEFVEAYPGFDPEHALSLWESFVLLGRGQDVQAFIRDYGLYQGMLARLSETSEVADERPTYVEVFSRFVPYSYWPVLYRLLDERQFDQFDAVVTFLTMIYNADGQRYSIDMSDYNREDVADAYLRIGDVIGFESTNELIQALVKAELRVTPDNLAQIAAVVEMAQARRENMAVFSNLAISTVADDLENAIVLGDARYYFVTRELRSSGILNPAIMRGVLGAFGLEVWDASRSDAAVTFLAEQRALDVSALLLAAQVRDATQAGFAFVYQAAAAIVRRPQMTAAQQEAVLRIAIRTTAANDSASSARAGSLFGSPTTILQRVIVAYNTVQNRDGLPRPEEVPARNLAALAGFTQAFSSASSRTTIVTTPFDSVRDLAIAQNQVVINQALTEIDRSLVIVGRSLPVSVDAWVADQLAGGVNLNARIAGVLPQGTSVQSIADEPNLAIAAIVVLWLQDQQVTLTQTPNELVTRLSQGLRPTLNDDARVAARQAQAFPNDHALSPATQALLDTTRLANRAAGQTASAAATARPVPVVRPVLVGAAP